MEPKKIVLICGHPDTTSFTSNVLDHYQTAAIAAGHEAHRFNLGELQFDPILRHGYKEIQQLEPDLQLIQDAITEADHIVIAYPNWWCSMPALLKGMFDRLWLPGFAFNIDHPTGKIEQHLKGKTARVFVLAGTHGPLKTWWRYGDFTNEIQYGILGFAGIKTQLTVYGPSENTPEGLREKWFAEIEKFAEKGV